MGVLRPVVVAVLVALAAAASPAAAHAQDRLGENHVKAAFLYNFAKFVQWPAEQQAGPLVIGIVGDDFFARIVDQIVRGKAVQGRQVIVRWFDRDDDVTACHLLFIGASAARRTLELLERLRATPVLTVGETPHFIREGGIARFFVDRDRVWFQIDPTRAETSGLKISAQLLSLSRH